MNEVHIPTVNGQSNVVSISAIQGAVTKEYYAQLDEGGGAPPIPTVIIDTLTEVGGLPIFWSYSGVGQYIGTKVGAFTGDSYLSATNGVLVGGQSGTRISKASPDMVLLEAFDNIGTPIDDWQIFVGIKQAVDVSTPLDTFNYILTQLDIVQLSLWTKIVVRHVDAFGISTITEVDGKLYRINGSFLLSSKVIRS